MQDKIIELCEAMEIGVSRSIKRNTWAISHSNGVEIAEEIFEGDQKAFYEFLKERFELFNAMKYLSSITPKSAPTSMIKKYAIFGTMMNENGETCITILQSFDTIEDAKIVFGHGTDGTKFDTDQQPGETIFQAEKRFMDSFSPPLRMTMICRDYKMWEPGYFKIKQGLYIAEIFE